jgi:hypothetical protein
MSLKITIRVFCEGYTDFDLLISVPKEPKERKL